VSETEQPATPHETSANVSAEVEEVDALPVLSAPPQLVNMHGGQGALPAQRSSAGTVLPAVQAVAVAAGGFVAGAAVVGLVHRRQKRSAALYRGRRGVADRSRRAGRVASAGELLQIVGSRSLLLDVHLLGGPGDR
jgi:hypothetical protein